MGLRDLRSDKPRLVVLAVLVAMLAVLLGYRAVTLTREARRGQAEVKAAVAALQSGDASGAARGFESARAAFGHAEAQLPPRFVDPAIEWVPWVGTQYRGARVLLRVGMLGSRAGAEAAAVIAGAGQASNAGAGQGLARAVVKGKPRLDSALGSVDEALREVDRLPRSGLVGPLDKGARTVRDNLDKVAPGMRRASALLEVAYFLFERPRKILILAQNGAELRPTGGFIGTYGLAETGPGGFKLERYGDVYDIPAPPAAKPPRGLSVVTRWSLRDANWWIDYPTSARAVLRFWKEAGRPDVDAVVAIDTVLIQELLAATGPLKAPGSGEVLTSGNLLDRLIRIIEVEGQAPGKDWGRKKDVLPVLADALLARVLKADDPKLVARAGEALGRAADQKHLQLYFTDAKPQKAVEKLGWAGVCRQEADATDVLAVVHAMVEQSKVNVAVKKRVGYSVGLAADGAATAWQYVTIDNKGRYPYVIPGRDGKPLTGAFIDYVRVYRPRGADYPPKVVQLSPRGGMALRGEDPRAWYSELGLRAYGRNVTVPRGKGVTLGTGYAGLKDGWRKVSDTGGVYRLYVYKQADLHDWPLTVQVIPPEGWTVTTATAHFLQTSRDVPVKVAPYVGRKPYARLATLLSSDLVLEVSLEASEQARTPAPSGEATVGGK
jgi:hypothetical protein